MAELFLVKPVGEDKPDEEDLEVRILTEDEVNSLQHIFVEQKAIFPNPNNSFFVGAVEPGGRVVAFLCFQAQLHAEPMHIEHGYEKIFSRLVSTGEKILLDRIGPCIVYCFTPAGKITQLAHAVGMQMEPWVVMSKIVATPQKEVV